MDGAEDVGGSGEAGEAGDVGVPEPATEFPVERLLYEDNLAYLADSPGRGAELQDVELAEDRVYVCAGWGFLIYDLPQPDTPFRRFPPLTGRDSPFADLIQRCQHVLYADGLVHIAARVDQVSEQGLLLVADVSAPEEPIAVEVIRSASSFEGMARHEGHLYVAAHGEGLHVFSASADGRLAPVGRVQELADAWNVRVAGDIAVVANGRFGIATLDVSDPAAPVVIATLQTGGTVRNLELLPDGRTVAAAGGPEGLITADISDPERPALLAKFPTPSSALDVDVSKGHAFLANFNDLRAFDLTDPAAPVLTAIERVHTTGAFSRPMAVAARDDIVAVAEWGGLVLHRHVPSPPVPEVSLDHSEVDFHRVQPGVTSSQVVLLKNEGAAALVVDGGVVFTTQPEAGRVFQVDTPRLRLAPGESTSVEVFATPTGEEPARGVLRLFTDDADERTLEIELRANDDGLEVGEAAPEFALSDLDGEVHRLSDHEGEVVLMLWFSTY